MIEKFLLLTLVIELSTIVGRAVFGSMRKRHAKMKLPVRIHHGYVGLAMVLVNIAVGSELLFVVGAAMFLSDFVHHFIVLPIWVGRTEFP